jgi:hypothetical protein
VYFDERFLLIADALSGTQRDEFHQDGSWFDGTIIDTLKTTNFVGVTVDYRLIFAYNNIC